MAQRGKVPTAGSAGGGKNHFPPEAYACSDDLDAQVIKDIREKVGIDFTSDEWEEIDGFGRVINA